MVGGLAIKVCKVFICNDFVFKRIIKAYVRTWFRGVSRAASDFIIDITD